MDENNVENKIKLNTEKREKKRVQLVETCISRSSSSESLASNVEEMKVVMEALERSAASLDGRPQNKSFSRSAIRDIERNNSILMKKIEAHRDRINKFTTAPPNQKLSSYALNRKKNDREINQNNLILLRKIQTVKPFGLSLPKQ